LTRPSCLNSRYGLRKTSSKLRIRQDFFQSK